MHSLKHTMQKENAYLVKLSQQPFKLYILAKKGYFLNIKSVTIKSNTYVGLSGSALFHAEIQSGPVLLSLLKT